MTSLIEAIESVLDESAFENLDLGAFYLSLLDAMMSNAKNESLAKLETFIPQLWDAWSNKGAFIQIINNHLASKKTKLLEKSCTFIDMLLQAGNIEELQFMKPFTKNLAKMTKQKSPLVRKAVVKLLKEAYLWMGNKFDEIQNHTDMDSATQKDLVKYREGVTSSEMKVG